MTVPHALRVAPMQLRSSTAGGVVMLVQWLGQVQRCWMPNCVVWHHSTWRPEPGHGWQQ
jgi:hypothetical protein